MLDLLFQIMKKGCVTQQALFPLREEHCLGLPSLESNKSCLGEICAECMQMCPTAAISIESGASAKVTLDIGSCIGCGLCVSGCPERLFKNDLRTDLAVNDLNSLVITNEWKLADKPNKPRRKLPFRNSLAVRVVSTGCSACDSEIGAAGNPIFDMERFGVQVVASPRMADALLITGPVPSSMHEAVKRTYEAMSNPRIVVAVGTCAISGGVHHDGYAQANGIKDILPVDIFIPGCPPHPWSIIHGLMLAMGRV
ncbi:MAG: NADH-quinone oxidoreductase subunit NuoB [Candidatus Obscuribacterales bacterium]|nr:NADH-quinone oxidoreductase subunit NuoB [Candidatus Obscuribacterales bacterium]